MIKKALLKRRTKSDEKLPTRITNETVAQHRERVLAGGRKLKYPVQYTRNALVRNAILISLGALVALAALVWLQLYVIKDTSDIAYRITRVIPLPVAQIDGENVRYSNYLLYHRSTISVLENQGSTDNTATDRMRFQQQQALERAMESAYARKLAKERNITVTDEEVSQLVENQRDETGLTEGAYSVVVGENLHWTMEELHQAMRNTLLRQKVAFSVDDKASAVANQVGDLTKGGKSLKDVAETLGGKVEFQEGILVPKNNSDGGLSAAAAKLEVNKTSGAVKTLAGDGYYFVTRHSSDDDSIRYSYIKVPLTVFNEQFAKLLESDSTKRYITIE